MSETASQRSHWTTTVPIVFVLGALATGAYKAGQLSSEQMAIRQEQTAMRAAVERNGEATERLAKASETRLRQMEDHWLVHDQETAELIPFVRKLMNDPRRPR